MGIAVCVKGISGTKLNYKVILQSYFINPLLETACLCYYNSCGFMYIHKAAKVICYI